MNAWRKQSGLLQSSILQVFGNNCRTRCQCHGSVVQGPETNHPKLSKTNIFYRLFHQVGIGQGSEAGEDNFGLRICDRVRIRPPPVQGRGSRVRERPLARDTHHLH